MDFEKYFSLFLGSKLNEFGESMLHVIKNNLKIFNIFCIIHQKILSHTLNLINKTDFGVRKKFLKITLNIKKNVAHKKLDAMNLRI